MTCRYGVVVDGERGNRQNIMAQQDLLSHTVRIFPTAINELCNWLNLDCVAVEQSNIDIISM